MPLSLLGAAVRHETLPQPPAGQPLAVLLSPGAALLFVVAPILPPSGSFHTLNPRASLFRLLSFQVQMNCLLALLSEYILREVPFDK